MYEDGSWIRRKIHIFESIHTGSIRIHASFSFGREQWCPLLVAFGELYAICMSAVERLESFCSSIHYLVSRYRNDKIWLQRDECVITFRELRLYAFSHEFASRKKSLTIVPFDLAQQ